MRFCHLPVNKPKKSMTGLMIGEATYLKVHMHEVLQSVCRQKHTVNAQFHSPCSLKNQNVISSLNTLYTVEKAKFYFIFCIKRTVLTRVFSKNAQFHSTFLPKTINMIKKISSYEENAQCHCAFLATALNFAICAFGENGE